MTNEEHTTDVHEVHTHESSHDEHVDETAEEGGGLVDFVTKALIIGLVVVLIVLGSYAIIRVIPSILSSLASVSVSVSSIFKPKTTPVPTATPAATVIPATPTPTPTNTNGVIFSNATPTPTPVTQVQTNPVQTTQTNNFYNPNARADLAVRVISTGIINRTNNQFIAEPTINSGDKAAVRFEIVNQGDKATGNWTFSALLPTQSAQNIYTSPVERSLAPGDRIEFTMGFEGITSGAQSLIISADEGNIVPESNENNNTATIPFSISGYSNGNNYNNGGYYGNGTLPDLAVQVLQTGGSSVQFQVTNIGGSATGNWSWSATLPTGATYNGYNNGYNNYNQNYNQGNYQSDIQPSLGAGQSVVFTMNFNSNSYPYNNNYSNSGSNQIFIQVDSANQVPESNESNNTATAYVPYAAY